MSVRCAQLNCVALALALWVGVGSLQSVRADDAHGPVSAPATGDHAGDAHAAAGHGHAGDADTSSTAGHHTTDDAHAVDYNAAPLPGAAPGLGTLFLFSLVLFGGFVLVARLLLWKPLIAALDEREGRINRAHAEADEAKQHAEQLLAKHSARMAEVHEQVLGLVAQARKDAEQEKLRIIAEAEAEAKTLRERAVAEIQVARDSALSQLNQSLDGQIAQAVKHVVGQSV